MIFLPSNYVQGETDLAIMGAGKSHATLKDWLPHKPVSAAKLNLMTHAINDESHMKGGGFQVILAPIGVGEDGQAFNINADLVAGAVAGELKAAKLILLTDVAGVQDAEGTLLKSLQQKDLEEYIAEETIAGGMIPKVRCCADALSQGVCKTHILDGRIEHAILLEMFTKEGIGTEIV